MSQAVAQAQRRDILAELVAAMKQVTPYVEVGDGEVKAKREDVIIKLSRGGATLIIPREKLIEMLHAQLRADKYNIDTERLVLHYKDPVKAVQVFLLITK